MNTYKLLVALSLLTNPDALSGRESWPDIFPFAGWDESVAAAKSDAIVFAPFQYLGDLFCAEVLHLQPNSGYAQAHAFLAPSLREIAVKMEIMDPRERDYLLHDAQNFPQDLKQLQHRYQDLFDAPPVAEGNRFPDRDAINELLASNRNFREDLTRRLEIDPVHAQDIQEILGETDQLHQVWNTLREARTGFLYIPARRQALKQLRDLIGEAAFYRGELPPNLPVWRLPRGH